MRGLKELQFRQFRTLAILLFIVGQGCGGNQESREADADASRQSVPVQAATATRTTLKPTLELVGTIIAVPESTAVVSSQLGGWVEKLAVVEGQAVKAGQAIVQLDPRTAKTDVARMQALVDEKTAALTRLKRGFLPQELEGARQDRDKARAAMEALRAEVPALKELLARRELSQVQFDTKMKAVESAQAAFASADAHAKLLEEGTRPEMIDEAQALLDAATADLEHAHLALQWCTIPSPIDGVVVQLLARQGQFFDRAAPLATIIDMGKLFVHLRIPSAEFPKVQRDADVAITVAGYPDRPFHGKVARIGGQADLMTGNVDVYAIVDNLEGLLRPGLGCRAQLSLPPIPDALVVPVAAIGDHAGRAVVTVIRDGKASEVEVSIGAETTDLVQIVKGLNAGDVVAISGGYGLPEGYPVHLVSEASATTASTPRAVE